MLTKENVIIIVIIAIIIVAVIVVVFVTACSGKKYQVDYCGQKEMYTNAKDSYKEGTEVKLYYDLIATDTDYSFYLDGESVNWEYDDKKGFVIKFIMPEHDVKLESKSRNSMEYAPFYPTNTMLVDYFTATNSSDDGDGHYELVLSTTDNMNEIRLDEFQKSDNGDKTCTSYIVPFEAVERCFHIIDENKLSKWNDLDLSISIDGDLTVCKFYDDGDYICVSTESMPENGKNVFEQIHKVMSEYICEEYLFLTK